MRSSSAYTRVRDLTPGSQMPRRSTSFEVFRDFDCFESVKWFVSNQEPQLHSQRFKVLVMELLILVAAVGCTDKGSGDSSAPPLAEESAIPEKSTISAAVEAPIPETPSPFDALPPAVRLAMDKPHTDDLDAMVKRRAIRVAVTFNRTHYFIDKGEQRGITYEALKEFEKELNRNLDTGNLQVHIVLVPLSRDQLYPALASGKVDMVAAMVTVRPELEQLVAFSEPTRLNVSQVIVTGPRATSLTTVDELSGREIFVRKASAYYESVTRLNEEFKARDKPLVVIQEAPEVFEDEDILEMVNAGLVQMTLVDDYLAAFWSQVFTDTKVHSDIALRSDGKLAVAFRKQNPQLRDAVNQWLAKHGKGDAFRNVLERRYLKNLKYAKNAAADAERRKFQAVIELFKKYGKEYDIDYLLMAAQGYQESTLDHSVESPVGAIGVMQVMPDTGKELKVGDITQVEANIHAGVKYMRFMMDRYFKDEPMDDLNKSLMTFAAYNAGPGRLRKLRAEAQKRGLDPNVWFGNVERIASERIGRETVTYVSNIYKYYIAYRLMMAQQDQREAAKAVIASK